VQCHFLNELIVSSLAEHVPRSILLFLQADTPGGMDYGLEDGEITDEPEDQVQLSEQEVQDAEYDPLMAGNFEVFLSYLIVIIKSQSHLFIRPPHTLPLCAAVAVAVTIF